MKSKFNFMDPKVIMTVVISLIILLSGLFAFFTIWGEIGDDEALKTITPEAISFTVDYKFEEKITEIEDVGNSIFSIVGLLLIITAILSVVILIRKVI